MSYFPECTIWFSWPAIKVNTAQVHFRIR
jgi:hypothetical protein